MSALVDIQNLSVSYSGGTDALENVNLSLDGGSIYGLVGVNGAGKSTLFKSIMGFMKPSSGSVTLANMAVAKALKSNLVSYVPQSENVDWNFPVLVEDVVMMGRYAHMGLMRRPKKPDIEAVEAALKRVDMSEYKTRQIGELSGGQKKRVFLARALAQGGQIILLDEPFTGVDVKTENAIVQLLRDLRDEGRLILVSTHNLGSVPDFCDEVILINKTVLAYGPVETTFTHENLEAAFGGMLRDVRLHGEDLHDDEDARSVTVLTDDERPLVFYGEETGQKIVKRKPARKKGKDHD